MAEIMDLSYVEDESFDRVNFQKNPLKNGQYEKCVFNQCDFSNTDLSGFIFTDCEFNGCNLSLAGLVKTAFQDTKFTGCKMLGLHFENGNKFVHSFSFENCQLDYSSFSGMTIRSTIFRNTGLQEVDFSGCDLTGAILDNCDMKGASFDGTTIEKADFRTSGNYSIDPERNRIRKARFSLAGIPGLLDKYDIDIET